MSKFTQPVCEPCFAEGSPGRLPVRLLEPELESCCLCGDDTQSGIYVRMNPVRAGLEQDPAAAMGALARAGSRRRLLDQVRFQQEQGEAG